MIYSFHPIRRPPPRSAFLRPFTPYTPSVGAILAVARVPHRRGRRPRRPVLPCFLCPRRAGCSPPAARPCTALPAGHTGPALQKCTAVGRDPCVPPHTAPLAKILSLRGRSAPVAIRIPLLHAKKEDTSRHPLFYTIESLENYFSSTLAPTSSSSFFMFSASSLDRASFRVVGVSSTAFLASARPRPVISRTDLMTLIF